MLGELQSLHRRITDLEDVELEVMERLEEAQQAVERYTADLAELETELDAGRGGVRDEVRSDLQADLAAVQDERPDGGCRACPRTC